MDETVGKDVYQDIAEEYAAVIDAKDANAHYEEPAMLSMMPDVASMRVLDAGCGPGVYSEWLLDHGAEVTGVDYSERMVGLARKRTGGRGTFHVADLSEPMEFLPDAGFDMVVTPLVLDYIRDWVPALQEFNRVLKEGGLLLLSCGHPCFSRNSESLDDYFTVRRVEERWGSGFSKPFSMPRFHRPLSSILSALTGAGFASTRIVEPRPTPHIKRTDPDFYHRLLKRPLFLCVLATKTGPPQNRVIEVVPYDEEWQRQFEGIRDVLAGHLHSLVQAIEHVGSTSVPGLAAKPILDIDIVISGRDRLGDVVTALSEVGYYHQGDLGIAGREAFARKDIEVPWDGSDRVRPPHHLYVCGATCLELASHLTFRDYLRQHPEDAAEYGDVKMRAARLHPHDIDAYMAEKAACVERIVRVARELAEGTQ